MFDVIVVGAGPAGVHAARQLRGKNVLLLDVGHTATNDRFPDEPIYELRKKSSGVSRRLLGDHFESLENIEQGSMSPKLKGPLMRFVTDRPDPVTGPLSDGFEAVLSYAKGGLANAWGAGVLRFTERDLKGFPIRLEDLNSYYDELTKHIGVNGCEDDLRNHLGPTENLMEPLQLSPMARTFFSRYERRRSWIRARHLSIGRPRVAILSQDHRGRQAYGYQGQDFFQPNLSAIYHPGYTLDEMISQGAVQYSPQSLVLKYGENDHSVQVTAQNTQSRSIQIYEAKKLILAAGAIQSAQIVLASHQDSETHLTLLDNPVSFLPLVDPLKIGSRATVETFPGGEAIAIYDGDIFPEPVQASFYGLLAPLRTDLLSEFPLPFRGNLAAVKYLIPAMSMFQVFYPDEPKSGNYIKLNRDLNLELHYKSAFWGDRTRQLESHFCRILRKMGYLAHSSLIRHPPAGSSIHYAGALPMRARPSKKYETAPNGLLFGSRRVHIADAATFPRLPSKNLTFTIMANAMRIAQNVLEDLS